MAGICHWGVGKYGCLHHVTQACRVWGVVQDNAKGLLFYHWNTPTTSNTEWIMKRKHLRSPYDRPFPVIAGSIGRQVRGEHFSEPSTPGSTGVLMPAWLSGDDSILQTIHSWSTCSGIGMHTCKGVRGLLKL